MTNDGLGVSVIRFRPSAADGTVSTWNRRPVAGVHVAEENQSFSDQP